MKFLKGLLIVLGVLVAAVIGVGFVLPSTAQLERSIEINSPLATVFVVRNIFKRFNDWSPWKKYDPKAVNTFSGPESGIGAKRAWTSAETGDGSQETMVSPADRQNGIKMTVARH